MNVLAPAESRFPLSVRSGSSPSPQTGSRHRPFGLRFYVPADTEPQQRTGWGAVAYRYCERRQVAVADDGTDEPMLYRSPGWDRTTTGNMDGTEEWKLDYTATG